MAGEINNYAVFTACNLAYLPKALALAESLRAHDQVRLKIYVFDRKAPLDVDPALAEILWIEEAGVPGLYNLAFKYDITEFSTCLKPSLTLELLKTYGKVIYLDPDILMYGSLAPVLRDLESHPIVLTPHYTTPRSYAKSDSDLAMMRFGSFNLGFYAVSGAEQALSFLTWWSDRCLRLCFIESQFGLSTDQKWVSIAPCFFKDLHVSFNPGYNAAFWNAHERTLSKDAGGRWLVNGSSPLVFFHFSSFHDEVPADLSTRPFSEKSKKRADLREIAEEYKLALAAKKKPGSGPRYAFDYMSGGEYISQTLRRAYACVQDELPPGHDPFDSKGPVGAFARRNFLFEKKPSHSAPAGYGEAAAHKGKFAVIYFGMRLVLRLLGANKFADFSRLLVYLSSYRQNRGLWKL